MNIWHSIVNETVEDTMKRNILEMALPLKTFKNRIDNLRFQLIENWCLLKYCQLYDPNNQNISHWGAELLACLKNLRDFEIKGKISKEKTLVKMLIDDYDYDESRKILAIIRDKFDIEHFVDMSKREEVALEFVNSLRELIAFLCNDAMSNIQYLEMTFGINKKGTNSKDNSRTQ